MNVARACPLLERSSEPVFLEFKLTNCSAMAANVQPALFLSCLGTVKHNRAEEL